MSDTAAPDSRAIRAAILDRIENSERAQWIRAAYDLGHADGATEGATAERERIRAGSHRMPGERWYDVPADLLDGGGDE